jgi:molecular chaperone GrpE
MVKKENKKQTRNQEQDIAELKDLLQRTQASFENFRKQSEKRTIEMQEMASKDVIIQVLPVVDNFELALKNIDGDGFVKGIELIYAQLQTLLDDNNVKSIPTLGKEFDPHLHEALMKSESTEPENKVIEEFQKGFMLNDKVIRCAKVKVSSGQQAVCSTQPSKEE